MAPDGDSGGKKIPHTVKQTEKKDPTKVPKYSETETNRKKLAAREFPSHLLPVE